MEIKDELWNEFKIAVQNVPMSLSSHQALLSIVVQVENQSRKVNATNVSDSD